MSETYAPPGKLDIGQVIFATFGVIRRNFVTFAGLSLLLAGAPLLLISLAQAQMIDGDVIDIRATQFFGVAFGGLAALILGAILQGALIYATVQDMNGERPSIAASLTTGLREFMPLLGVSILLGIAIVLGLIFLVIPGVFIACLWCVAVPCLIAENTTVTGAFDRSAELTRGNRWRILGLFVLAWIAFSLLGAIFGAARLGPSPFHRPFDDYRDALDLAGSPVFIVGNLILKTATSMIASTGIAVLYVELRKAREAQGSEWWSDIF